jgi:hypothetical protein
MEWIFCSIDDSRVIRDNFNCGIPQLNDYLKKYARPNQRKGIAKTKVRGDRFLIPLHSVLPLLSLLLVPLPQNLLSHKYQPAALLPARS